MSFCQRIGTDAIQAASAIQVVCRHIERIETRRRTMDLKGKAVVVTGGSRGLGAALAGELALRGARVLVVAREPGALERTVSQIRRRGGEVHGFVADVADRHATHAIAGAAASLVGEVDVLVHNASTLGPTPLRLLLDTECEDLAQVLETNLVGPFRLSKAIGGSMALRRTGLIVHVSSDASVEAYPTWGAYSVSKAALDHLSRILAVELAAFGVRTLSVDPGEMRTQMHRDAVPGADERTLADPAWVARALADALQASERIASGARIQLSGDAAQAVAS
jgi:NAD(P)-dependent dehydrogenase (short-subunit alcohol dehydrogenase family)